MFYAIRHFTRYRYSRPVWQSMMEVRMHPRSEGNQRCFVFQLSVNPRARIFGYTDSYGAHMPVHIAFSAEGFDDRDGRLPPQVELVLYRVVQEALTNVAKHAHATRVLVSADVVDEGIRIEVVDDGAGFVVAESVHMPGHLGLLSMKERAQLAGGWFRVESEPGAGAKVEFWVPQIL